jgi:hypothetical protein
MPQQPSETSVSTLVSKLSVGESVVFKNKKRESVAVMVSNLKRIEEHSLKTFKIKDERGLITVTRNS